MISSDWLFHFASMLAYNLLVAFFPIVLALISISGLMLGRRSALETEVVLSLSRTLPEAVSRQVDLERVVNAVSQSSGLLGLISLAVLVWSGAGLFGGMEACFAVFFRVPLRPWLRGKLMAMGMVLLLAVLAPLIVAASSLAGLARQTAQALQLPGAEVLLALVGFGVGLALAFVLFLCIYLVVPNLPVPPLQAAKGAATAAVLAVLLTVAFPYYLAHFMAAGRYGAAAAFALILGLWFWGFAVITLLGAEVVALAMGLSALKADLATLVSQQGSGSESEREADAEGILPLPPSIRRRARR